MAKNETLAHIVAELREISKMSVAGYICQEQIADYADRIEAAAKHADCECRHNEEIAFQRGRQAAPSNVAEMREALEGVLAWFDEEMGDDCGDMDAMLDRVQKASAAPPRNCDRFATPDEAEAAWFDYKTSTAFPPGGWRDADLIDWLLSPATPEKGGDK